MYSQSEAACHNVSRDTYCKWEDLRKSISEELATKKSYFVNTRFSIDDLATLELIRRITASPSRSEAIRLALKIAYGVLAEASEVKAGRIVIQNPIVNLNINNNHNEVKPTININLKPSDIEYLERLIQDLLLLLESKVDSKSMRVIRSRAAKAERILEEIRKGVVN